MLVINFVTYCSHNNFIMHKMMQQAQWRRRGCTVTLPVVFQHVTHWGTPIGEVS